MRIGQLIFFSFSSEMATDTQSFNEARRAFFVGLLLLRVGSVFFFFSVGKNTAINIVWAVFSSHKRFYIFSPKLHFLCALLINYLTRIESCDRINDATLISLLAYNLQLILMAVL